MKEQISIGEIRLEYLNTATKAFIDGDLSKAFRCMHAFRFTIGKKSEDDMDEEISKFPPIKLPPENDGKTYNLFSQEQEDRDYVRDCLNVYWKMSIKNGWFLD